MAVKGMSEFRADGENYTINDPNIANEFSSSTAYSAGTYVNYQGDLYVFTADHAAGAWTGTDASKVLLGENVAHLKSALNTGYLYESLSIGTLIPNEAVMSSTGEINENAGYSRTDYIELPVTDTIKIINNSGEGYYLNALCFYNTSKNYISGISSPDARTNITVPNNAKYIIYSGYTNMMPHTMALYKAKTKIIEVQDNTLSKNEANSTLKNYIIGDQYPNNLINVFDWVNNAYIEYNSGNVNTNNASNYFCTGFIPVTGGLTYKANHGRNLAWYTSEKTYINGVGDTSIQTGVTAPSNAAFIRFTINKTSDGIIDPCKLYFTTSASYSTDVVIKNLIVTDVKAWCYSKKINWIGDSIVDSSDFDDYVCSALNLTQLTIDGSTGGIDGSTIALKGDGTDGRTALCARYNNMPDNADIIAVSCGTNDWMYAWSPIGTISDPDDGTSNTTFYGALKALCKGLIDKYPQKVIFFTTPIKRAQAFASGAGGEYTPDGQMTTPFSKNKYGKTLGDYADIIKEVCGLYSIPVLDMYRESLLNPHIESQQSMFDNVYTHPNATGAKIMARRVAGWMTQLGYKISGLT